MFAPRRESVCSARVERRGDFRVEPVEQHAVGHREPQAAQRHRGRDRRFAGEHRVDRRAARDAARDRSDRVERRRQRICPVARHARRGGLEADEAAERRGNADRAAGVGGERRMRHAFGDRHRRARRRTARDASGRAVVRSERRAVVGIEADAGERELGHVGAADEDGARGAQPCHRGCVACGGRCIGEHAGPRGGGLPGDVEEVLDRHRYAVERRDRPPGAAACVGCFGGTARAAAVERDECDPPLPRRIVDTRERLGGELRGRRRAAAQRRIEFGEQRAGHAPLRRRRAWRAARRRRRRRDCPW